MLKLLLDEHISPDVAVGLRRRNKNIQVLGLAEWENGQFLGTSDEIILRQAAAQRLTLATYDLRTIPPLIKQWSEEGRNHGGIIFVDGKTIRQSDFGGLIDALAKLYQESGKVDWTNRVCFLRR